MSKINDKIIQSEEWPDDEQMQKWREETRKLDELAEQWNGVYQQIDGVIGSKREKDREV